ncbi:putative MO25-like protein At5g47540 isoform X1 [Salvia miltiorrhiza]|uniref:putative MO25-like protein At5g47540 isoform X1 n=1 Tax=Salvia miltiorrhiza TaxID=226208 RepID=UPI0025AD3447|nr:putative MO25-like protein At5g47540 isoform X1 [Salvia miltiorrhiza]
MMKGFFKPKPKTPAELVRHTRDLLIFADRAAPEIKDAKRDEKMMELSKVIRDLKHILYGDSDSKPVLEACAQLTQEFFREDTLRLLITCLPKLNFETRKHATQIVANLQGQRLQSRLIACEYLEKNLVLMDILIAGYENNDLALHYGAMLRECIRHQCVAKYILDSEHMKKFFEYIQLPNFDIASDAAATFKELLTRHKSTVADFLSKNDEWFFADYNSRLLVSTNYITRRQAVKLLGDILLDRSNSAVMIRYVSSRDNLRILMNLLRVPFLKLIEAHGKLGEWFSLFHVLIQHHMASYLQPIRTNPRISLISWWRIEANFFDLSLVLTTRKRMNNLILINHKLSEKFQPLNPINDQDKILAGTSYVFSLF